MGTFCNEWRSLTHSQRPQKLERLAGQVVEECGLPVGHILNLDNLEVLQSTSFSEFQVKVISADHGNVVIACVPEEIMPEMQIIYLLLDQDHFDLITSPAGFFRDSYFCEACNKAFSNKEQHRCGGVCRQCNRFKEDCPGHQHQKCTSASELSTTLSALPSTYIRGKMEKPLAEKFSCAKNARYSLTFKTDESVTLNTSAEKSTAGLANILLIPVISALSAT